MLAHPASIVVYESAVCLQQSLSLIDPMKGIEVSPFTCALIKSIPSSTCKPCCFKMTTELVFNLEKMINDETQSTLHAYTCWTDDHWQTNIQIDQSFALSNSCCTNSNWICSWRIYLCMLLIQAFKICCLQHTHLIRFSLSSLHAWSNHHSRNQTTTFNISKLFNKLLWNFFETLPKRLQTSF